MKAKANRVYESMTRIKVNGLVVRVWRSADKLTSGPDPEVVEALTGIKTLKEAVKKLDELERVAAFEILDHHGNGSLVYPDWN